MRAAVLYGSRDVRIEERSEPALTQGEVRLEVGAALTCGTDLKVYKRGYHARMLKPPCLFGHEIAGIVIESQNPSWKIGERVVAANSAPCGACYFCQRGQENLCDDLLFFNGAYAQRAVIPPRIAEKNMLRLSAKTSFSAAALTEPLACVVQGFDDLKPQKGETILVIGSGPIGLMFVRLAKEAGSHVTVAGRGEERLKTAAALGADEICSGAPPERDRGYDIVFEAVGKPETWEQSVSLVRKGGRVNFFGGCPSGTSIKLDTTLLHYSSITLLASFHHKPETIRKALSYIELGVISPEHFISGECALEELPALLESMAEGNRAVKTLVKTNSLS